MKRLLYTFLLTLAMSFVAATDYYRISSFPVDGADIRDSFLIVVQYAGNTYIWDGQNATGKNYVLLQDYQSDVISGDYADNEVAIVHNQYYKYPDLFSVLCKGDGDRDEKGGYYLAGVGGGNGITFNAGQMDAIISFEETEGIKIATKSGQGYFRFNITPNDPHGFKFYQNDINMLYPTLYVKGQNTRYLKEVIYEDLSEDFTYAQADLVEDKTLSSQPKVQQWDFSLNASDNDDDYPQIYLKLTNNSKTAIAGTYLSTVADGQPWQAYCTNSSLKSSTYTFISPNGNPTILYLKYCALTLTPLYKDQRGVYTYRIDLKWIDQNNKHRKVLKELPIIGQHVIYYSDSWEANEMFFEEQLPDALPSLSPDQINLRVIDHTITADQPIRIYNITGKEVTGQNGNLTTGIYIVRANLNTANAAGQSVPHAAKVLVP